jgi:hypothetical protein
MGVISTDADQGLVTSLVIYIGAIAAGLLMLVTPVYLLATPKQVENHGMAVYAAPAGTRLLPGRGAGNVALAIGPATRISVTTFARR